jgi:hypothetical protein
MGLIGLLESASTKVTSGTARRPVSSLGRERRPHDWVTTCGSGRCVGEGVAAKEGDGDGDGDGEKDGVNVGRVDANEGEGDDEDDGCGVK